MRRIVFVALSYCVLLGAAPMGAAEIDERIATYAEPLEESGFLSGCLLVSIAGKEDVRACFGYEDGARRIPNGAATRFCIASLSKPMTTVAILRLVEQKSLRLSDPVSQWIADFPAGDSISVADLLTHTAGIPHRVTTPDEERQRLTPEDIVARIQAKGLLFPPHSRTQYSSAGYTVLAYIIERVTEMSFGDAMSTLVFLPLGMCDTFHPDGQVRTHRATSFVAGATGPVEAPAKDYAFLAGAGSLYSTCDDMLRFAQAYLHRQLLTEAGWDKFHELGWAPREVVRWSGSTNGFGSWIEIHGEDGTVYVFLGNAGTGGAHILLSALPALIAGEEVDPPPRAPERVTLTQDQMHGLEGGYARNGSIPTLLVSIRDGVLYMGDSVVYPIAVDRFFNPMYFSEAAFTREEGNAVVAITITAPGLDAPLVFKRVK